MGTVRSCLCRERAGAGSVQNALEKGLRGLAGQLVSEQCAC